MPRAFHLLAEEINGRKERMRARRVSCDCLKVPASTSDDANAEVLVAFDSTQFS